MNSEGVVVITFVCDNQHHWIVKCTFHVFACWTASHATTLVISPENGDTKETNENSDTQALSQLEL